MYDAHVEHRYMGRTEYTTDVVWCWRIPLHLHSTVSPQWLGAKQTTQFNRTKLFSSTLIPVVQWWRQGTGRRPVVVGTHWEKTSVGKRALREEERTRQPMCLVWGNTEPSTVQQSRPYLRKIRGSALKHFTNAIPVPSTGSRRLVARGSGSCLQQQCWD